MPRRILPLLIILLGMACVPGAVRAEEEPAPGPPPDVVLLARIEADPVGEATRLAHDVAAALGDGDDARVVARLLALLTRHPDVLVPLAPFGATGPGRTDGALRWPARRVVNRAIARLPDEPRGRILETLAPRISAWVARAERGEPGALRHLADRFGASEAGSTALLVLAARAEEGGRLVEAARDLESWLELNPGAAETTRAAVAVRLADVLLGLADAGALQALALAHGDLREVVVTGPGGPTTLAARLAEARLLAVQRRAEAEPAPEPRVPQAELEDPIVLWSRSLRDPDYLRQGFNDGAYAVQAGAWGRDDLLVLHEGRVVRRLDPATGLERWHFPRVRQATMHDVTERYQEHDLPWRCVTPAGDAVLVALGEPAASGRYEFLGEEYEADGLGQECRVRLACLDLETGALRWYTGGVDETHPVLGDRGTGLAAPPLVVGDDVYCIFARRAGATSFHLACLDLRTGRHRWVCDLAGGDSGRDDDEAQGARFTNTYVQSVPWGARPALAGGEVCVVPHAGFAAGVDARDGEVHWVRALPRHAMEAVEPAAYGHSNRNEPIAWGDAWILAPMDSPRMLCLARGTGDLRWQVGGRTPARLPPWRDLLGIEPDADGAPVLRLSGDRGLLRLDPADGARYDDADEPWERGDGDPGGRVLDLGAYAVRATNADLQVRPWRPNGVVEHDALALRPQGIGVPYGGDVVDLGRVWLVIGPDTVAAVAQPRDVPDIVRVDDAQPAAVRATRLALGGRLETDVRRIARAVEAARAVEDDALRAAVLTRVVESMLATIADLEDADDELARLRTLAVVARTVPVDHRGPILRDLVRRFFALDAHEDGVRICLHWITTADDTLVPRARHWDPRRDDHLRGDLLAAGLLRRALRAHADDPGVAALLAERERTASARLAAVRAGAAGALREVIRRHAGTRAAEHARRMLVAAHTEAGRFADAAAVLADLRMDPPFVDAARPREERLRRAARLQMQEAELVGRAGDGDRARTLAADLERWSPTDLLDARGRDATALARALRDRFGWHPRSPDRRADGVTFDVWPDGGVPEIRDEIRGVDFLALRGPGAAAVAAEYALIARGLTIEVWSLARRERVAALSGRDAGWFGGSLRSIDRWVPGGGILVTSLVAGEPADSSGVRDGDWVHTWAEAPVTDLPAFMQLVASSRPGERVPVGIWRDGARVLDHFTAGERPLGQGRLVSHDPLWVDARGRVLVPGRTGLAWVDPAAGTRTPHWTWRERGVVRHVTMRGGEVFVAINRGLLPDLLVRVDLESGAERWRVEVPGAVTWAEPVGSALWIQSVAPGRGLLVDRHDGSVRGAYRTFDRYRHAFRRTWEPDREADVAAGRAYVAAGTDADLWFRILNATTGTAQEASTWSYRSTAGFRGRYVNPMVSAGAYACVACQGGIRFFFPDPLGEQPPQQVQADRRDLMGDQSHHGPIDSDSRLYVRGHTLYLLRLPLQGRKNVNVHVFGLDYEAVRHAPPTATGSAGKAINNLTHRAWLTGPSSPYRYVLDVRATFEGILVSAARLSGGHEAETWWIAAPTDDAADDNIDVRLLSQPMSEARRHVPRRAGPHLFVPVDRGAKLYPVVTYGGD